MPTISQAIKQLNNQCLNSIVSPSKTFDHYDIMATKKTQYVVLTRYHKYIMNGFLAKAFWHKKHTYIIHICTQHPDGC